MRRYGTCVLAGQLPFGAEFEISEDDYAFYVTYNIIQMDTVNPWI